MWKRITLYGLLLAAGTLALQWFDYQRLARAYPGEILYLLVAVAFLVLGVVLGARVLGRAPEKVAFDGNPQALQSLGISPREAEVLRELAAGYSNKQIAARLAVSPNTVKTHVGRLLEKLQARRRTEAIRKARELGLVE